MYQIFPNSMSKHRFFFVTVMVLAALGFSLFALPFESSQAAKDLPTAPDLSTMPLAFIANAGQSDAEVAFHTQSLGGDLFFTANEVVFALPMPEDASFVTRMDFVGAETTQVSGYSQQEGVFNFFLGNDPDQWHTNVPSYAGVRYRNLYPGIDLRFEGTQGVLKGTYAVAPGADPAAIAYRYIGAQQMTFDAETGDLNILLYQHAEYGDMVIVERAPVAWQTIDGAQVPVDVRFMLNDAGHVGFALGNYNPAYTLIIDPFVQYSTYFGGFYNDIGYDIIMDNSGNGYLTGRTFSPNLPRKNALQNALNLTGTDGGTISDAFVAKLNVSISTQKLVFGTFLGGSLQDEGQGIVIDAAGNIYVTGQTTSTDFPLAGTPFQSTNGGVEDAFVAKILANGSALAYATYLGGSGEDMGRSITVDASGNAYVTGYTTSSDFPLVNAIQGTLSGTQDAFVTKLTGDGSGALYSTYLGGSGIDEAVEIDIDIVNQPYVVGHTDSADFPTSALPPNSPFQATSGGGTDGFVTKLLSDGSTYNFSTYFGGTGTDQVTGIVVDVNGIAYITGWTTSTASFPTTLDALQANNAGAEDAFIASLSAAGDTLNYGTFLGGSLTDKAAGITQDPQGIVHIAGETFSSNFIPAGSPTIDPVGSNTFDTLHGSSDVFAAALNLTTNTFFYAAYIGGGGADKAYAIAVDASGGIYITGETDSTNFPLVNAAYQRGGNVDAFMVKIGSSQADLVIVKTSDVPEVLVGQNVTYTIDVINYGPAPTHNVVIEDTVPVEASVVSIDPPADCTQVGQLITCEFATINVGELEKATVTVVATASTKGVVENTAQITESSEFDPDTSDTSNSSTATVVFYKDADLSIDVSASTHRPQPNQTIDLIVEVTNLGLAGDANVVVASSLPTSQVTYISHNAPSGTSYNPSTGVWTIGAMARDQVRTLTITVTVGNHAVGTEISYPASVSGVENDPDLLNNADTAELVVVGPDFPPYGCFPSETDPDVIICITGNSN